MATLDKLLIKGIRSFSPENTAVLQFDTPLTLIVGQNGAGKTTVIEALQYAVTGECPPNSGKGKAFVHDPKVSHDSEVKALIRLQWKTPQGRVIHVVRTLQLTQKDKKKSEFKSLDNVVRYIDEATGEPRSLSKTCADTNVTVPQMFGVSKAIIENVIFVHQDDANWPLSEGAVLKKKFDDIFAATKYTKALETIRKLKNELAGELKEKKADHNLLKERQETAATLKKQVANATQRKGDIEERIRKAQEREQELDAELGQLHAKAAKIRGIADQIKRMEAQRQMQVRQNAEKKAAIEDPLDGLIDDPLKEVEETIELLQQNLFQQQQELGTQERQLADKRLEIDALRQSYERQIREQGTLEAEKRQFEAKLAERWRLVLELPGRHPNAGFPQAGANAGEQAVEAVYQAGVAELRRYRGTLQEVTQKNEAEDAAATAEVDARAQALAAESERVRLKRGGVQEDRTRLAQVQARLQSADMSSAAAEEAIQAEAEANAKLDKARAAKASSDAPAMLAEKLKRLDELQERLEELRAEREALAQVTGKTSQAKLLRTDAAARESKALSELTRLRLRIEAAAAPLPSSQPASQPAGAAASQPALPLGLSQFLGFSQVVPWTAPSGAGSLTQTGTQEVPPPAAFREFVEPKLHEVTQLAEKARVALQDEQRRAAGKAALIHSAEGTVRNLTAKLQEAQAQMADVVFGEGESVAALEEDARRKADEESRNFAVVEAYGKLYTSYEHTMRTKHQCGVCKRGFAPAEEAEFQQRLEKLRLAHPDTLREAAEELRKAKEEAERWQRIRPLHEEVTKVRAQLAAAQAELNGLRAQHQEMTARAESLQGEFSDLNARRLELESLHGASKAVEAALLEAASLRERAAKIQAEVGGSAGGIVDEEQLKSDLMAAENDVSTLKTQIKGLERSCKALDDGVAAAEKKLGDAQRAKLEAELRARERVGLQRDLEDLSRKVDEASRDLLDADARFKKLQQEKEEQERARAEQRENHKTARDEARKVVVEIRRLQGDLDKIDGHARDIENFKSSGKLAQLESSMEKMRAGVRQREQREAEFAKLEEDVRTIRGNADLCARQLHAAQQICAFVRGVEQARALQEQVDKLRRDEAELGSETGVAAEMQRVFEEKKEVSQTIYEGRGQTSVHGQQLEEARKKLKDPAYKNIEERFRENALDVRLRDGVLHDLEKYYTAVDKALVAFHGKKMAEINTLIKDYWQKTYQGADIEYIAIKSDSEGAAARSYNYRVVMVNPEGAELDMRGRCSAGQKVLACLIIRLALAEAFCNNCGILALDEPTTNLDEANSRSLAESLSEIMKQKRGQSSFQLVVITHDRNFANLIGQREHADFFWQITKDEAQHSKIEKVAIYD